MLRFIKKTIRNIIPTRMHVPLKYWYAFIRGYTEPEMTLLKNIIKAESTVIDAGANQGIYSYFISKFCKNIQIFEPNSECFNLLKSWANSHENIIVYNEALSNEDRLASLLIPIDQHGVEHDSSASIENNNFSQTREETVRLNKLDSFNFSEIDFIKIDVEGHEFPLLQGAYNTIKISKPCLLIEIEQRHNKKSIFEIFNFLEDLDYLCFYLDEGKLYSFSEFNIAIHQQNQNINTEKKYINNFLFFDKFKFDQGHYSNLKEYFL